MFRYATDVYMPIISLCCCFFSGSSEEVSRPPKKRWTVPWSTNRRAARPFQSFHSVMPFMAGPQVGFNWKQKYEIYLNEGNTSISKITWSALASDVFALFTCVLLTNSDLCSDYIKLFIYVKFKFNFRREVICICMLWVILLCTGVHVSWCAVLCVRFVAFSLPPI